MGNSNVRPRTLSMENDLAVSVAAPEATPQEASPPPVASTKSSFDPQGDPVAQLEAALSPLKRRLSRDAESALPPQLSELTNCLKSNKGGLRCLQPAQAFVETANALPAAT
ncbi:Hypothetical predicted protein [Cloeon dipterum]|uniref:Uncharacterized protein n=1 Tax=Cloeon dipterum TaxID=197152 RepID=A0A8S1DRQ8_9INSE|nr:Hypothetical predicted protein [Cloeon dipterum]